MEECKHKFVKAETVWKHVGLWKHLIMTLYCEHCGKIIQEELDRK